MNGLTSPLPRLAEIATSSIINTLFVIYTLFSLFILRLIYLLLCVVEPLLKVIGFKKLAVARPGLTVFLCHVVILTMLILDRTLSEGINFYYQAVIFLIVSAVVSHALYSLNGIPATLDDMAKAVAGNRLQKWLSERLRNPIDAFFLKLALNASITIVPAFCFLFFASLSEPGPYLYFAVCFLSTALIYEQLDHTNIHNRIFQPGPQATRRDRWILKAFNIYLTYILNPIYLRIPHFYDVQHVYIHHAENNGVDDTQTTIIYDRMSFIDYCKFSVNFGLDFSFGIHTIPYLIRKKKIKQLKLIFFGLLYWVVFLAGIAFLSIDAAVYILSAKILISSAIALTLYSWHGFADPEDPENIYQNSINVVVPDEHGYLGSSFHLEHHLKPGLHWSKLAGFAHSQRYRHADEKALTWFYGGGFFSGPTLLKALWLKKVECLLPLVVVDDDIKLDREEVVSLLKERTRPIKPATHSRIYKFIDDRLGSFAANMLLSASLPPSDFRVDKPTARQGHMQES